MPFLRSFLVVVLGGACAAGGCVRLQAGEFIVLAYNVEMCFDVDGVSLLDEYSPDAWGPVQLDRKLAGISRVLQRINSGRGPDIICFNEFEADQTPESAVTDLPAFLKNWPDRSTSELLQAPTLAPELAGLPVEAWLAKRLTDDGLPPYHVTVGSWRRDPTRRLVFHTNAVFSRFPIKVARTHNTNGARGILEVQVEVDGHLLYVFNNHWKSGASDPRTEPIRIGNAEVLRRRLDEILRADPHADIILAGDFNSQHNQKQRYRDLPRTAFNDVLGSQGDELAVRRHDGPALYNLWFELPPAQRGSDIFRDEWGTLMHLLVTRGLYDFRGVQYVDNSFAVAAYPGLNTDAASGRPVRWHFAGGGAGFSDHLPIGARFRTVADNAPGRWLALKQPSRTATDLTAGVPVKLDLKNATVLANWPRDQELRTAENLGRFFQVTGRVTSVRPFRVTARGAPGEFVVFIHDPAVRNAYFARYTIGDAIHFVGELGQYRGEWQFVIPAAAAK